MNREIFITRGTRGEYIYSPNTLDGKCIHSYQVVDYGIPYDVVHKVGDVCFCCKEIVRSPLITVHKRYGYCTHGYTTDEILATRTYVWGEICRLCGQKTKEKDEPHTIWEELKPQALIDRTHAIRKHIVIGSIWLDKSDGEIFTIKKIERFRDYDNWMCFIDPHPPHEHWYVTPEHLAEKCEPL